MARRPGPSLVYTRPDHEVVLGLHAHFEPSFERRLVRCLLRSRRLGMGGGYLDEGQRPHMTMGSWVRHGISPAVVDRFEKGLKGLEPYPVHIDLYLALGKWYNLTFHPVPTPKLLAYHKSIHRRIRGVGRRYRRIDIPGQWFPHSALLTVNRVSQVHRYLKLVEEFRRPVDTALTNFSVVCYGIWPEKTVLRVDLATGRTSRLSLDSLRAGRTGKDADR